MPSTFFTDNVTVIEASWLNDVDDFVFTPGSGSASPAALQARRTTLLSFTDSWADVVLIPAETLQTDVAVLEHNGILR